MFDPEALVYWHWFILAACLFILEVFSPGVYFIWIGAAAAITGLLMLLTEFSWQLQLLVFACLSVIIVMAAKHWLKRHPIETDQPNLNRKGAGLIGQVFIVDTPIVDGRGKIRVADTVWTVTGEDAGKGAKVRITGVDSMELQVEKF